jgi:ubiquinone/menaquinone biosynthesis C-methylase UbiE
MNDLKFIAQQLRKPSGDFAPTIGEKMNEVNRHLYDLTFSFMDLSDNDKILEIGFGNGAHFEQLITLGENLKIYGIDYSGEMVNEAAARNKMLIDSGRLHLHEGSSDTLPFADQTFDIVFCNMVIYFWDNPDDHLKEIYRVLKPAGKFYTGIRTKKSMLGFQFTKYGFSLYTIEEWKSILVKNGFSYQDTFSRKDPSFEENGMQIQLESVCIAAEKAS